VPTAAWGGLLLTLVLTAVSIVLAFPLGVLLALGRWSDLGVVSTVSALFIEVVRGVPLITILFFAKLVVPFFISASTDIDQVIRMMIGLTLFTAAYIAEIVRGGLQIVPHGQLEAAHALGLNTLQTTRSIVLPQALRAVIPAIMSQFVSLFKDTTLVAVVGLFELLGIIDFIVNGQQQYRGLQREAYLFVGIIYFVISFGMSTVSRWIERTGVGAARR
jgi:general L-amino acid transport system permease protein